MNPPDLSWQDHGACNAGTSADVFFPPPSGDSRAASAKAKAICHNCPVRTDCLEHAVVWGEHYGIWGGLTQDELKVLRGRRARRRL